MPFPDTETALRLACQALARHTGEDATALEARFIFSAARQNGWYEDHIGGPAVAAQIIINRAQKRGLASFTRSELRRLSIAKSTWNMDTINDALSYMIVNGLIVEDITGNRITFTLTGKGIDAL